jgi:hypothetical protein
MRENIQRNSWESIQQQEANQYGNLAVFRGKGRVGILGRLGIRAILYSLQGYEGLETLECVDSFDCLDS